MVLALPIRPLADLRHSGNHLWWLPFSLVEQQSAGGIRFMQRSFRPAHHVSIPWVRPLLQERLT